MAKSLLIVSFTFVILMTGCTVIGVSSPLTHREMDAVCRSQDFLRTNGYLNEPAAQDRARISLGIWDRVQYVKNGQIDWERLLADRHGRFASKLFAYVVDGVDHLVVYRVMPNDTCVRVSENLDSVHKMEGNCRPPMTHAKLVREDDLRCEAKTY